MLSRAWTPTTKGLGISGAQSRLPGARRVRVGPARCAVSARTDLGNWQASESLAESFSVAVHPTSSASTTSATTSVEVASLAAASPASVFDSPTAVAGLSVGAAAIAGVALQKIFSQGSRKYVEGENTVGDEYNAWTDEGVLEYYWGEHIHLGYYSEEEMARGYKKKNFIQAKIDFVDEMLKWSEATKPKKIIDVGCGIGGTTRILAQKFPEAEVIGITLSSSQVKRATELAQDKGLTNVTFKVMDALNMDFEENQFDLVWACESGEHMPDKKKYVEEMCRVLKPGGRIAIATWCQKDCESFTAEEEDQLKFLYEEWAHPYFISHEEYARLMQGTQVMTGVQSENWVKETIASWRHSIWVGVWDPWIVVFKGPWIWYKTVREIITLERMHRAFDSGLMTYGMIKGVKVPSKWHST